MKVSFYPINITTDVDKRTKLLDAAIASGICIAEELCARSSCGRCKVIVSKGNSSCLTALEKRLLTEEEIKKGIRLACCFVVEEDCSVIVFSSKKQKLNDRAKKTDIECTMQPSKIAVDLGTTSIEVMLDNGLRVTDDNPQKIVGADVISRISACIINKEKRIELQRLVLDKINEMCLFLLDSNDYLHESIEKIAIVGNTTMIHLLLGKDVTALGRSPFTTGYFAGEVLNAYNNGININKHADLQIPNIIGGHVGSDAYACILNIEERYNHYCSEKTYIIIDIGTNGEIILHQNGCYTACSTAAGPAFEGSTLSCGMKLDKGAIRRAYLKKEKIIYDVEQLGEIEADDINVALIKGITGSGIIDISAIMLKKGYIDNTGACNKSIRIGRLEYTQEDIRMVQLAKSAIYSAILALLDNKELTIDNLDCIYIAGSFGHSLNIDNAISIGLLPKTDIRRYVQTGNSALEGAMLSMRGIGIDRKRLSHIELSESEYFRQEYINYINFS